MSLTSPHRRTPGWTPDRTKQPSRARARLGTGSWRWLYATDAGVAIAGPSVRFATEAGAQQWLEHNVDALFEQHIAWVSLLDGEHVVDGPLSVG